MYPVTILLIITFVYTEEANDDITTLERREYDHELAEIQITEADVLKKPNKLKIDKSPGPDNLHPRLLKELKEEISVVLTLIYNQSLLEGILPEYWKTAIFKKGDKAMAINYRSVSLTCIICKVLESLVRDHIMKQIMKHLNKHKILLNTQHGFRKKSSCETQLLPTVATKRSHLIRFC